MSLKLSCNRKRGSPIVDRIKNKIEELYGPKEIKVSIFLERLLSGGSRPSGQSFRTGEVEILTHFEPVPNICVPETCLRKCGWTPQECDRATPDEGRIEITVHRKGDEEN